MFGRILVATDFSEPSLRLFDFTLRFAKRCGATHIVVMHVDEEESVFGLRSSRDLIRFLETVSVKREQFMADLVERVEEVGLQGSQLRVKGTASDEILDAVGTHDIDLVAMSTAGVEGVKRILIGSTTKRVLIGAPCPVLTTSPDYAARPGSYLSKILYPFDFSDSAVAGVRLARAFCETVGARLELVQVLKVPTLVPSLPGEPPLSLPQSSLEERRAESEAELEAFVRDNDLESATVSVTIGGDEAEAIADYATETNADLIVIPRGGRSALNRFLFGRVAHGVAKISTVPVLSLPPSVV